MSARTSDKRAQIVLPFYGWQRSALGDGKQHANVLV